MCGIAGCIGEHPEVIANMTAALVHRGPDGNATYTGNGISLGHARLAILDPSPAADQPMWSADGNTVMVFNGEIFNYREIAKTRGFHCKTGSDTEVLLHLFQADGADFLRNVRGMYALAVYDKRTRELWLARDHSGIKPLYIRTVRNELYFASEVRALLQANSAKPELNYEALSLYMHVQYVPRPHTLCAGITALEPGILLHVKNGNITRRTITTAPSSWHATSRNELISALPDYMQQCVDEHMVSDKPVGIFLSGGMDSSVLLHHMAQGRSEPIRSYTVRFEATAAEGAARFNTDADLAQLTAKTYGTIHTELLITADMYRSAFRECARALDLPNSDHVSVAQYLLAKTAKPHVDVVLGGAGGDELFGGYPRYRITNVLQRFGWIPKSLRRLAGSLTGFAPDVCASRPGAALWERLLTRPTAEVQSVVKDWYQPKAISGHFAPYFRTGDAVRQAMEVDRATWLIDESLKLVDGTTMGSGVEARVPFLDQRLIECITATPGTWHVDLQRTKTLLKEAYRSILPSHLYTLPKASFYPPVAKWLRRECAPLVDEALENAHIRKMFKIEHLESLWKSHHERQGYHLHVLMNVVQLAYWFDEVLEAPSLP
jgi:asparagine synthase (glutamine-hydrolysing)